MKTKKIRIRQGFTIVELVIVIGVIGILSAILIPTFINLTNKANQAADESLIKNLNTQLRMKEAEEGKNRNMTEALADALEAGYKVENLTPKSGKDIVWNQEKDEFFQLDSVPADGYKYWTIAKSNADLSKGYSSYLYFQPTGDIKVGTGFDIGEYSGVNVTYERAAGEERSVIVRTNGGNFTVNAPSDVVSHYSDVDKVTVEHVKGSSYHEYGRVRAGMEVQDGHVVVEEAGYVEELSVPETAAGASVSVSVNNGGTVNSAVVDDANATVEVATAGKISQYVGDANKVSGAGAQAVKDVQIEKTFVYNSADEGKLTLKEALEAKKPYIVFAEDISVGAWSSDDSVGASLTYEVTIDGGNHKLTTSANRGIWVDESNVSVSLKNFELVVNGTNSGRGVQVNGGVTGVKLALDNINISKVNYYAINICNNAGVELSITNSKVTGWGALNLWAADYKVYVANCELNGINDKGYNANGWNNFATIVLEGDTTGQTDLHSSNVTVDIRSTKITARTTGQGNRQSLIGYNDNAKYNNVWLSNCTLETEQPNFAGYNKGSNNSLYIDGEGGELPSGYYFSL